MKKLSTFILSILTFIFAIGQDIPELIPFKLGEKWGYCDSNKKIIVEPIYDYAATLKNGYAIVGIDKKCGLLNTFGNYQIPPEFSTLNFDRDSVTWTTKNDEKLIISISGIEYKPQVDFDYKYSFREGFSVIRKNNKYGIISSTGELITPFLFDSTDYEFSEGRLNVRIGKKWGVVDNTGRILCEPIYDQVDKFSDSMAIVIDYKRGYGFIDINGNEIITPQFYDANVFHEGISYVKTENRIMFINKKGEVIYKTRKNYCGLLKNNRAYIGNGISSLVIDRKGKVIFRKLTFNDIGYYTDGVAPADNWYGKFGYIDLNGHKITKFKFDYAREFKEGMGCVELDGKHGFVNTKGVIIIPIIYDEAMWFKNGVANVEKNGEKFYIDKRGVEYFFKQ